MVSQIIVVDDGLGRIVDFDPLVRRIDTAVAGIRVEQGTGPGVRNPKAMRSHMESLESLTDEYVKLFDAMGKAAQNLYPMDELVYMRDLNTRAREWNEKYVLQGNEIIAKFTDYVGGEI